MNVKLPTSFSIDYPKENLSYYSSDNPSKRMGKLLIQASKGYCMYCGVSLDVEGMDIAQIEHSVDKKGNINQKRNKNGKEEDTPLTNCKYNLAIACKDCNMKYKKSVKKVDLKNRFKTKCPQECEMPCQDYIELRNDYIEQNKIILQPQGIYSQGKPYEIEYDLFKHLYIPFSNDVSDEELVQQHIMRFRLNGEKFSESVLDICSDVVELYELGIIDSKRLLDYIIRKKQINVIGKIFLNNLYERFYNDTVDNLLKYCRTIVLCSAWI